MLEIQTKNNLEFYNMEQLNLEDYVIKDDFYNSIEDEIICTICTGLKKNPVMCSKCQNSFCSLCIENWKKKSPDCPFKCKNPEYIYSRIINNLLSKLTFKCKNNCNQIIPFDKLESHYEFECVKIDLKEKNKVLSSKYKEMVTKYNKLKNSFMSLLNFELISKIIEDPDDLLFLKKIFSQFYKKKINLSLLYRATKDGDTAQKFHEACDNKTGGILIIIQTDKNLVFGGFSDAEWIPYSNPEKKTVGKSLSGSVNFLFQLNNRKVYTLREVEKPERVSAIFCRVDCGPCFGCMGEDIWCHSNFLTKKGILHKDKEKGRKCSFNTDFDYELNNGESFFKMKELEAFLLN